MCRCVSTTRYLRPAWLTLTCPTRSCERAAPVTDAAAARNVLRFIVRAFWRAGRRSGNDGRSVLHFPSVFARLASGDLDMRPVPTCRLWLCVTVLIVASGSGAAAGVGAAG